MKIKLNEKGISRLLVLLRREVMVNPGREIRIDWEYLEPEESNQKFIEHLANIPQYEGEGIDPLLGDHYSGMSHSDPLGDEYDPTD